MAEVTSWHKTACNLCYANCGIEVGIGGENNRQILKVKGDNDHPKSKGYICNKAARLDYYQNSKNRLLSPKKRLADGSYQDISWDQAVSEIAEKMSAIKEAYGGDKIFFYGGGGQGNQIGATYAPSLLSALGGKYTSNPASQEKTGYSFVFSQMVGAPVHAEIDHAEVVMFSGKNPFMSHGMDRGRAFLREIKKDPNRKLIVLDPRKTETADFADIHLAVKHGRDAWCLAAIIAQIVQHQELPMPWLEEHTQGYEKVIERFSNISVKDYAEYCGVAIEFIEETAEMIATANSFALEEDLGVQMAPHSTLNSYLDLLLQLVTGHFGKPGTMGLAIQLGEVFATDRTKLADDDTIQFKRHLPVTKGPIVSGLYPAACLGEELDSDDDDLRPRAIIIESSNPVHCLPGSDRMISGLRKLECSVAIDVAMTETARECDYVLPASTQYEKWEATFFPRNYPENIFHLRKPVFEPAENTFPEAEIYARIIDALGVVDQKVIEELRAAADQGMDYFGMAFMKTLHTYPQYKGQMSYLLYRGLGPALPEGQSVSAVLWGLCQRYAMKNPKDVARAGFTGRGAGTELFKALTEQHSGTIISVSKHEETFEKVPLPDKKLNLVIGDLLRDLDELDTFEPLVKQPDGFEFVLVAGSRRAYTANCIMRDPDWIKGKGQVELTMHPDDAELLGVESLEHVLLETEFGKVDVAVAFDDRMARGSVSLPNGQGMDFVDEEGNVLKPGVWINKLTSGQHRDKYIGTPLHKFVPARIQKVS